MWIDAVTYLRSWWKSCFSTPFENTFVEMFFLSFWKIKVNFVDTWCSLVRIIEEASAMMWEYCWRMNWKSKINIRERKPQFRIPANIVYHFAKNTYSHLLRFVEIASDDELNDLFNFCFDIRLSDWRWVDLATENGLSVRMVNMASLEFHSRRLPFGKFKYFIFHLS